MSSEAPTKFAFSNLDFIEFRGHLNVALQKSLLLHAGRRYVLLRGDPNAV